MCLRDPAAEAGLCLLFFFFSCCFAVVVVVEVVVVVVAAVVVIAVVVAKAKRRGDPALDEQKKKNIQGMRITMSLKSRTMSFKKHSGMETTPFNFKLIIVICTCSKHFDDL